VKALWQTGLWAAPLEDWERLVAADPLATPYSAPAWVGAWLRHLGDPAGLVVISVVADGRVVGLAPLVRVRRGPVRVLVGAGQRDSDHWGVIAEPALRDGVAEAVAHELYRRRDAWDLLQLSHLPPPTPFPAAAARAGLRVARIERTACPRLHLAASFDDYLAGLSQSRRGNLRRRLRQLDSGKLELRAVAADALDSALERWQAIRRRELAAKGVPINPVHVTAGFRAFLREALAALIPQGRAALWEFAAAGAVVGSYVNLLDGRGAYLYLGGYEPEARSLALGKVVVGHAIRESIAAGRSFVDFGRGGEEYKYWYGARDGYVESLVCGHARPRSSLVVASLAAVSAARVSAGRHLRRAPFRSRPSAVPHGQP
jgi:CelD/BcsL family acetyltransferase involved in cellulose biosynthesis